MGVGIRQTLTTKNMSDTSQFSLANRKHLADVLADRYDGLRRKAKDRFREKAEELRGTLLKEHAEKKGANPTLKQIDVAERKINELTAELKQLGFYLDVNDGLRLYGDANPLDKIIDAEIKKTIGTERDIDARFDSAQVAMMTVATLQDAHALLESVQKI